MMTFKLIFISTNELLFLLGDSALKQLFAFLFLIHRKKVVPAQQKKGSCRVLTSKAPNRLC